MRVLTINNGHNATVGLFEDGECLAVFHEEKFNNKKNYTGVPHNALKHIEKLYGLKTIDRCVFAFEEQVLSEGDAVGAIEELGMGKSRQLYSLLEYKINSRKIFRFIRDNMLKWYFTPKAHRILKDLMLKKYKIPEEKIYFTDHHTNHCLSPFYFYKLEDLKTDFLLFSLDGTGDGYCARIYKYKHKKNTMKEISNTPFEQSVGLLYREVTKFLGMKPLEHEYKVMGLAAYVTEEKYYKHIYKEIKKIIWFDKKEANFKSSINTRMSLFFFKEKLVGERFDNLAAAVQKLTKELVIKWVKAYIKKTGIKNIALSGGVFMNVKINQKIVELDEVKKAYFQPSCGDDSLIIGAAAKEFRKEKIPLKPIKTMFLGHEYSNKEVEKYLKQKNIFNKYEVEYFENIEKEIARLVADYKIVPRFKGKGEWGARSLCNRAILGNASDLKTFYRVNDQVKMRDFWMPFAPTMLDSWGGRYIKNWDLYEKKAFDSTKYMILTFDTTDLAREHLRAAIHQKDFTMRPQIVSKEDSEDLYILLKYYEEMTGMGGLLNTSLNIHGYPLVGTLDQALFTLENSGLEYLTLENYLIKKKE
jgi:carbamoyltransferase